MAIAKKNIAKKLVVKINARTTVRKSAIKHPATGAQKAVEANNIASNARKV